MKTIIKIVLLSLVINIASWIKPQTITAQEVTVGFQTFYDDLSPYGTWVDSPQYGYVWVPSVEAGFTPYGSNGYWVNTDYGWTWVSNYSWGWAPFHYGRWYADPIYGNMWVPGNEWGPGWVTWRQSEGYYGWAPIGPGISIEVAYSSSYNVPSDRWCFVGSRDFGRPDISNHYVNRSTNVTIINNTTVINNRTVEGGRRVAYNAGPPRGEVEKRAGKTFAPVAIKASNKPGQVMGKGELQIYKPQVNKNNSSAKKEAPAKVVPLKEFKPSQKVAQPAKQEQTPQKKEVQPSKQQSVPSKQKSEPNHQQPLPQKNPVEPGKQQPTQTKLKSEPSHQQTAPQKNPVEPPKQQPKQQQRTEQPPQQKTEAPRQQPPRDNAPPHQQVPRKEAPRQEPPRQEEPRQQQGNPAPKLEGEGGHPH